LKSKTLKAARAEVADLVSTMDGVRSPFVVRAVVLDARL
jgi:hypothetical protein